MYGSGYSQYRTQAAATASPAQLVLMLYNGALAEVTRAERALTAPVDVADAHDCLSRAQAIVNELAVTLDRDRGGQIAGNLARLYEFCLDRLVRANVAKSVDGLADVAGVLTGLRDVWEQACCAAPVAIAG